jgi:hypothetical protein
MGFYPGNELMNDFTAGFLRDLYGKANRLALIQC